MIKSSLNTKIWALAIMLAAPLVLLYPGAVNNNLHLEIFGWIMLLISVGLSMLS